MMVISNNAIIVDDVKQILVSYKNLVVNGTGKSNGFKTSDNPEKDLVFCRWLGEVAGKNP